MDSMYMWPSNLADQQELYVKCRCTILVQDLGLLSYKTTWWHIWSVTLHSFGYIFEIMIFPKWNNLYLNIFTVLSVTFTQFGYILEIMIFPERNNLYLNIFTVLSVTLHSFGYIFEIMIFPKWNYLYLNIFTVLNFQTQTSCFKC